MKFQTEEELTARFLEFVRSTKPDAYRWIREFDGGLGLADIVLFRQRKGSTSAQKWLTIVPPRLAVLLSEKVGGKIQLISDLQELIGSDHRRARAVASELKSAGLLTEQRDKHIRVNTIKVAPYPTIISIEAKLRDWRRGLVQACRYSQYSHQSWVLLDTAAARTATENLQMFKQAGVGLASFSTSDQLYVHLPAKHRQPSSDSKFWRAQAILARQSI